MTAEQAIQRTRQLASERGWPWQLPVEARRRRSFLIGPVRWHVRSNAGERGMNVRAIIDDATGAIVEQGYLPR